MIELLAVRGSILMTNVNTHSDNGNKIKIVYLVTRCTKSGPIDVVYNIAANLDKKIFEPYIVTLYPENSKSIINLFKSAGISCLCAETNKSKILLGQTQKIKSIIDKIAPDIIHSHGAFPGVAASRLHRVPHMITLHCFMRTDYLNEYGIVIGRLLEALHMHVVKKSDKTLTCSQSLTELYRSKYNLKFDYVLNGIEFSKYRKVKDETEKVHLRKMLNLPYNKKIFVYAARLIQRKNQVFLCEVFSNIHNDKILLLLGDGDDYQKLKDTFGTNKNIIFTGYKSNVYDYLCASDVYISSSKSEGMPLGVLEALACGLPVILSDIPQHCEIVEINGEIGCTYKSGDITSCIERINYVSENYEKYREVRDIAAKYFDAKTMSANYQKEYISLINRIG